MGDTGLLLLQWQSTHDAKVADAMSDAVEANLRHKTLEALWGSPGSLLGSIRTSGSAARGTSRWMPSSRCGGSPSAAGRRAARCGPATSASR
jgi:hypothetical protein